ncbi:MAG: hypothetical protein V5A32_00025 [Halovenus sp.]
MSDPLPREQIGERAVNTVVDVSLALLFVGVAVTTLTTVPLQNEAEYDPHQAEYTAETLGSSTINVTYSAVAADSATGDQIDEDTEGLRRETHGSIASLAGGVAVAKGRFDTGPVLTNTGSAFEKALDERVQTALVESSFETNVTAVWKPFDSASIRGTTAVGQSPPDTGAVSTASMTVPSTVESVREDAIEAVEHGGRYEAIAELLAEAVIEGYLPELESKRALERSGPDRTLTRQRYERMARAIDGADPDDESVDENVELHSVDTDSVNEYLVDQLTDQFEAELATTFESPGEAAAAVSAGEVTIAVRAWQS